MTINEKTGFCEKVLDHCMNQVDKVKSKCINAIDKYQKNRATEKENKIITSSLKIYTKIIRNAIAQTIDLQELKKLEDYDVTVVDKIVKKIAWGKELSSQLKTTLVAEVLREYKIAFSSDIDDVSKKIKAAFPQLSDEKRKKMCTKINNNLARLRKDFESRQHITFFLGQEATTIPFSSINLARGLLVRSK